MQNPIYPNFEIEDSYRDNYPIIAGLDEAGRGPLAGPVVAAAVILPNNANISDIGINDSKKISEQKREEIYSSIIDLAIDYGIGAVGVEEIDRINILQATQTAFRLAIDKLETKPNFLLVDGNYYINKGYDYKCIVKGDAKSLSIAAASILAKVTRDRWMSEIAEKQYPGYEFYRHKGYATKRHFELIKKNGISDIHRRSFLIKFAYRENQLFGNY